MLVLLFLFLELSIGHPTKYAASPSSTSGPPEILSYHVHVVYMIHNDPGMITRAMQLRAKARIAFSTYITEDCPGRYDWGRLCLIDDHDFNTTLEGGPFPVGEW